MQECPEIVTAIKFLIEDGRYRYTLSGSLLGVELKDIRSVPVGYLSILEMYPLDFQEFCKANKVSQTVMDKLRDCFEKRQPVDELIHEKMMELYVGLLASMYVDVLQLKILNREKDINFGAIYENVAAQELKAHGFELYYFNSKKQGELDFVIEYKGNVLPLEIKSGKSYTRHNGLDNVLRDERYAIPQALVFCNENVTSKEKITYLPIYMVGFLEKEKIEEYIYSIDLSAIQ